MKLKIKLILAFFSIVLILNQNFISAKNVPAKQKRNLTTQDSKPQFMPGQIRVKFKPQNLSKCPSNTKSKYKP